MQSRIMYIECKGRGLSGPSRIGRVRFSQTGKSIYYTGKTFRSLKGFGYKSNYYDIATGEHYWITGCKKRGDDRLYGGVTSIDEDVREEYWTTIRGLPHRSAEKSVRC